MILLALPFVSHVYRDIGAQDAAVGTDRKYNLAIDGIPTGEAAKVVATCWVADLHSH
jgi:hypothetical protein